MLPERDDTRQGDNGASEAKGAGNGDWRGDWQANGHEVGDQGHEASSNQHERQRGNAKFECVHVRLIEWRMSGGA